MVRSSTIPRGKIELIRNSSAVTTLFSNLPQYTQLLPGFTEILIGGMHIPKSIVFKNINKCINWGRGEGAGRGEGGKQIALWGFENNHAVAGRVMYSHLSSCIS